MIAINVPQSKTVSIAFISLKAELFGILAIVTGEEITARPFLYKCNISKNNFIVLIRAFFVVSLVVDLSALCYFSFTKKFNRVMFYVYYIYHWIISLICMVLGIVHFFRFNLCTLTEQVNSTIFVITVIMQVDILVAMLGDLFLVLKYLHFGCDLVWTFLWYLLAVGKCSQVYVEIVGVVHVLLGLVNFFTLFSGYVFGSNSFLAKRWKFLTLVSIFMMMLCYLVVLVGEQQVIHCSSLKYFLQLYMRFGLLQLLPAIFLLIFMRGENGDPRQFLARTNEESRQSGKLKQMLRIAESL